MNGYIKTIVVAPLTTSSRNYPTRIPVTIGGKKGWIVIDQIRTIDKIRLQNKIGSVASQTAEKIKEFVKALQEELAATIKEPVSVYFDVNPHDGLLEIHNVDKSRAMEMWPTEFLKNLEIDPWYIVF